MNCKKFFPGIVGLTAVAVFLFACCSSQSPATPVPTWTPLPTIQSRPDFIRWVTPEESSFVAQAVYEYEDKEIQWEGKPGPEVGYASTVCVSPALLPLAEKGDVFTDFDVILGRIDLEVDGISREPDRKRMLSGGVLSYKVIDGKRVAEFGGPYSFCWQAPVDVGIHLVSFRFRQTSGAIREYKWRFATTATAPPRAPTATPADTPAPLTVVFPLPTPGPRPDFITEIVPQPATAIPSEEFNDQVCVGIDRKLLFGDSPYDHEHFSEHLRITLNGAPIEAAQVPAGEGVASPLVSDTTKVTVGEEGPSPLTRCWLRVELEPGLYQMAIEFEKPSGQVVGYDCFFAIT